MFLKLFLLFTIIPFVEIVILIRIGSYLGFWTTILLIIVTGIIGAWLSRMQGYKIIKELQATLQAGKVPTQKILEGVMILVASILLITPGVLTDIFGLMLLTSTFRLYIISAAKSYFINKGFTVIKPDSATSGDNSFNRNDNIEDAEFEEVDK